MLHLQMLPTDESDGQSVFEATGLDEHLWGRMLSERDKLNALKRSFAK